MDNEVSGTGNIYDYGFRIYNPRIAKFLSVDPLTKDYPMLTPYQYASNNPIMNIDIDGLEGTPADKEAAYRTLTTAIQKYAYYDVGPNLYADKYYPVGQQDIVQSEQSKTDCSHLENNVRNPKALKSLSDHNLIKGSFRTEIDGFQVVGEFQVVVPLAQEYSIGYVDFTNTDTYPDGENPAGATGAAGVDQGYYIRFYNRKPNEVDNPIELKEIRVMWFENKEDFLKFKEKYYDNLKQEALENLENNIVTLPEVEVTPDSNEQQDASEKEPEEVCFVKGTYVRTPNGYVEIDKIEIGDTVYSCTVDSFNLVRSKVINCKVHEVSSFFELKVSSGDIIRVTNEHPFYLKDIGWTKVKNLKIGDVFYNINVKAVVKIVEINNIEKLVPVYNITVNGNHNYFISRSKIRVHNK